MDEEQKKLIESTEQLIETSKKFIESVRGGEGNKRLDEHLAQSQKCIDESRKLIERLNQKLPTPPGH